MTPIFKRISQTGTAIAADYPSATMAYKVTGP